MNQFGQLVSARGFGLPASLNFRMIKLFHLFLLIQFVASAIVLQAQSFGFEISLKTSVLLVSWCAGARSLYFFPTLPLTPYVAKKKRQLNSHHRLDFTKGKCVRYLSMSAFAFSLQLKVEEHAAKPASPNLKQYCDCFCDSNFGE